ncbi:MAG TPA: Gfo/Idh/MocA family oxidoreductase, partial [Trueperaceae bacterium]|nr:Gfo/Idh/MocA family oxidoreductase [Trueperaceae bacterium]
MAVNPLRIALVGAGANIAGQHLAAIEANPDLELTAVCDVNTAARSRLAERTTAPFHADIETLLAESAPDIVAVTTPHPFHLPIAEAAFAAGAHVLVEKPMAVTASEADRMIAAAKRADRLLAVSFQQRFSPLTERLHEWVASGELGAVQRVAVSEPWLRTAAYFAITNWRATWRGEGGGVLLNQAPHALDLLTYLLGLPRRVTGLTRTARHGTETEDTAHALLEWEDGCVGYFHSSTTEPETGRRLELIADRAKVVAEGNLLSRTDFEPGLTHHAARDPEPFGRPRLVTWPPEELAFSATHVPVYADLVAAIREDRALRC